MISVNLQLFYILNSFTFQNCLANLFMDKNEDLNPSSDPDINCG